jgi:hypothetical protein
MSSTISDEQARREQQLHQQMLRHWDKMEVLRFELDHDGREDATGWYEQYGQYTLRWCTSGGESIYYPEFAEHALKLCGESYDSLRRHGVLGSIDWFIGQVCAAEGVHPEVVQALIYWKCSPLRGLDHRLLTFTPPTEKQHG